MLFVLGSRLYQTHQPRRPLAVNKLNLAPGGQKKPGYFQMFHAARHHKLEKNVQGNVKVDEG